MLTTLPLEAFVCRSVMTTYYFPDEPFNPNRHLIFTTSLVVTSMVLALVTCDLGMVFELIGATSAAALAYIFPPLCYIKLSSASRREKIPAYACVGFGVIVMAVSVAQAIANAFTSKSNLAFPCLLLSCLVVSYCMSYAINTLSLLLPISFPLISVAPFWLSYSCPD